MARKVIITLMFFIFIMAIIPMTTITALRVIASFFFASRQAEKGLIFLENI